MRYAEQQGNTVTAAQVDDGDTHGEQYVDVLSDALAEATGNKGIARLLITQLLMACNANVNRLSVSQRERLLALLKDTTGLDLIPEQAKPSSGPPSTLNEAPSSPPTDYPLKLWPFESVSNGISSNTPSVASTIRQGNAPMFMD